MNRTRLRLAVGASFLLVLLVLLWPRPARLETQPAPAPAPAPTEPRRPESAPPPRPDLQPQPPIAAPTAPPGPERLVLTRDGPVDELAVDDDLPEEELHRLLLGISLSWSAVSGHCLTPWARSQGLTELTVDYEMVVDTSGLAELTLLETPGLPDAVRTCIEDVAWAMPMPPLPVPGRWTEAHHARIEIEPGPGSAPRSLEQLVARARNMLGLSAP